MQSVIKLLNESKKIAVFTHINSDGDALGSSIALKQGLETLGKQVDLYCDDDIHENYHFLGTKEYYVEHNTEDYDLAIIADCPELNRIGKYASFCSGIAKKLVLDHHVNNTIKADVKMVDENAGSVGVLVYRIFKEMKIELNKSIATSIYTSVASDTGCFVHCNTTSEAHLIAAEMLEHDIELENINFYLFKRKTKTQITLLARALSNIQFHENNKIALAIIDKEDFKITNATYIDTIGISSYVSGIDGISLAIVLTETIDNVYLVSLRSTKVDCTVIAQHFNGGGHKNASGCRVCGKKENAINKLLEVCKREL